MDLSKAYRICKKRQALARGVASVRSTLTEVCRGFISVEAAVISSFADLHGYRVVTEEGVGFMPRDVSEIYKFSGVSWIRTRMQEVGVVVPPYFPFGYLVPMSKRLGEASGLDRDLVAKEMLCSMYQPDTMATLIVQVFCARKTFSDFEQQFVESAKAFQLGLFSVAISGILPCVEGVLRSLCERMGIAVGDTVNIRALLVALHRFKQSQFAYYVSGYDWYPKCIDLNFLDKFHEVVQMVASIEVFVRDWLYLHSSELSAGVTLNRHAILHGLMRGYGSELNYLRLFNFFSALTFVSGWVEGKGNIGIPNMSPESNALAREFEALIGLRLFLQRGGARS